MRIRLGLVLAAALAGPVLAEPAACDKLIGMVEAVTGLGAPPAGMQDGWCVLDGARSSGQGLRVTAGRLRVRGEAAGDRLLALEVMGDGLRAAPALNDREVPDWLRDLVRLQSAVVHLSLRRDEAADILVIETGQMELSGGGELVLMGEIAGAELSVTSLLTGRMTKLYLEWQNDGRTLRPIMEAWGERLKPGATGTDAVLATRSALLDLIAAMPEGSLLPGLPEGLEGFIEALPQGRGRLLVMAGSDNGIGAAELGLLALAKDPTSPEALARFFAGTRISASWTPGLQP